MVMSTPSQSGPRQRTRCRWRPHRVNTPFARLSGLQTQLHQHEKALLRRLSSSKNRLSRKRAPGSSCRAATGAGIAQEPKPRPQTFAHLPEPQCQVCGGAAQLRACHRPAPPLRPERCRMDSRTRRNPCWARVSVGSPDRIRTGVTALRGRRPGPLDDGAGTIRDCSGMAARPTQARERRRGPWTAVNRVCGLGGEDSTPNDGTRTRRVTDYTTPDRVPEDTGHSPLGHIRHRPMRHIGRPRRPCRSSRPVVPSDRYPRLGTK